MNEPPGSGFVHCMRSSNYSIATGRIRQLNKAQGRTSGEDQPTERPATSVRGNGLPEWAAVHAEVTHCSVALSPVPLLIPVH